MRNSQVDYGHVQAFCIQHVCCCLHWHQKQAAKSMCHFLGLKPHGEETLPHYITLWHSEQWPTEDKTGTARCDKKKQKKQSSSFLSFVVFVSTHPQNPALHSGQHFMNCSLTKIFKWWLDHTQTHARLNISLRRSLHPPSLAVRHAALDSCSVHLWQHRGVFMPGLGRASLSRCVCMSVCVCILALDRKSVV